MSVEYTYILFHKMQSYSFQQFEFSFLLYTIQECNRFVFTFDGNVLHFFFKWYQTVPYDLNKENEYTLMHSVFVLTLIRKLQMLKF